MKNRALGLIVVLAGTSGFAFADIVANGDFSAGYLAWSQVDVVLTPTHNVLPSWTVDSGSLDLLSNIWYQAPGYAYECLDLNGQDMGDSQPINGSISQQIDLHAGTQYLLSFYMSANPYRDGIAAKHLELTLDGQTKIFTYDKSANNPSHNDMKWELETYRFTASSDTATLRFASLDAGTPYGPALGAVHCEAVPEPFSLALGIGALGMALRRRKATR